MKFSDGDAFEPMMVTWLDAASYTDWFGSQDELPTEPIKMESLGWRVYQDDAVIVLATTASEFKLGDLLVIPMGCVESIDALPGV